MKRVAPNRMTVNGVEYVTTAGAIEQFLIDRDANGLPISDVTPAIIRDWKYRGLIHAVRDPAGNPVRLDGENVFLWEEISVAERATRVSRTGRRRPA